MALADWRSIRSDSVLEPCMVSHATWGDMIVPVEFWMNFTGSWSSADFDTTAPPTVALCPSRYLVVECTT